MDINSFYSVSDTHIESYRNNGFVHLPQVCSKDEIKFFGDSIRRVVKNRSKELNPALDDYFMQTLNLRFDCSKIMEFVISKRFGKIVAELMGVKAVRLFHEQILFKKPKTKSTPWHQDLVYWPLDTNNALGMWMALCDVSSEMGPVVFAKGSHKHESRKHLVISEESEQYLGGIIEEYGYEIISVPMNAGDVTIHNGWTIHGALENSSNELREAMIVTFYEDGTRVIIDNAWRENDAKTYLDGCRHGEKAASKINPVTWSN